MIEKTIEEYRKEIEEKLKVFQTDKFSFEEKEHVYTYENTKYDSVTTFLKIFKEPFKKDYWANKKAIERGISKEEILKEWNDKASSAGTLGTDVHKWIEDFWTGLNEGIEPQDHSDPEVMSRVGKFMDVYEKRLSRLVPLKSELKIFSRKWRLAGTIDQPFLFWDDIRKKPLLIIGDWKTNKEFKHDDHPKGKYKKLLRPFADLYENQHNEYSIQISLYRLILEEEAGIETEDGFLCHIGPDEPAKLYRTKDLRERLKIYLGENRIEKDIFLFD
jgi:hypothetical protein